MTFLRSVARSGAPFAAFAWCALTATPDAAACGGCFHPATDTSGSVVTDHRMVFEITSQETILWDQVRYAGDPKEFAWVLPVRAGARIELSRDEWIAALDAATRTTVEGPRVLCPPRPASTGSTSSSSGSRSRSSSSNSGGGGCGGGYSETTESAPGVSGGGTTDDGSGDDGTSPTFAGNDDVEVVAQSSIGPYQAVTLRAASTGSGAGIREWLTSNGFVIPASIAPVIDGYTQQKLDFIALRLRPNQGVRAMRPVRIVTPGADTTLPLRMVAAGVGAKVGLTLWVIGEGRYGTQNFPEGEIDWSQLAWNVAQRRSNRTELEAAALASNGGRSWITEAAIRTSLAQSKLGAGLPNVFDAYTDQCRTRPKRTVPCDEAALPPADGKPEDVTPADPDGGADEDAGGDVDGGVDDDGGGTTDGGASDGGTRTCTKVVSGCDGFDDLTVASRTLHAGDAWVTRLRADLPVSALATDLQLAASAAQVELSPTHKTSKFTDPSFDPCASRGSSSGKSSANGAAPIDGADGCTCRTTPLTQGMGTWALIGATMVVLPRILRRRRDRG